MLFSKAGVFQKQGLEEKKGEKMKGNHFEYKHVAVRDIRRLRERHVVFAFSVLRNAQGVQRFSTAAVRFGWRLSPPTTAHMGDRSVCVRAYKQPGVQTKGSPSMCEISQ